jgi:transposase
MNLLEAEEWHMFKEMHEQGMTVSEIARRTRVSRPTVRKYVGSDKPPVYGSSTGNGRLSILEPYKPYIRERIEG